MFQVTNRLDLAEQSLKALNKLNATKQTLLQEHEEKHRLPKINYAKFVFEEYDDQSFEKKVTMDSAYYDILLHKLDETQQESIHTILGNMLSTVKAIYETINVKPKIYGLQRLNGLNENKDNIQQSASRIISDFISRNYYKLTQEEREHKYIGRVKHTSKELILTEGIDPKEAVQFSLRSAVIMDLLEHINFPMTVKNEIETSLSSSEYAQMFDPAVLNSLWDTYQEQSLNISKIISAIL